MSLTDKQLQAMKKARSAAQSTYVPNRLGRSLEKLGLVVLDRNAPSFINEMAIRLTLAGNEKLDQLCPELKKEQVPEELQTKPVEVIYHRAQHAGHYMYGHPDKGHDLEQWSSAQPIMAPVPEGVPANAEYHHGFRDNGVQHWVFTRTAPLTGTCQRCEEAKKNEEKDIVRLNAEMDPNYRPYCLRCRTMDRMAIVEHFVWKCKCGCVADDRMPGDPNYVRPEKSDTQDR